LSSTGGDIDVLVNLDEPVERQAVLSARLSAMLSRQLHGRAVDVILSAPNITRSPVHHTAEKEGRLL